MFYPNESTTDQKVSVFYQKDFMIVRKDFTFNQRESINVREVLTN